MRSRYKVIDDVNLYFISSTVIEWIPVFISEKYLNILVGSFRYSQKNKNLKLYGYVMMDNHFHAIVSSKNLIQIISSLKSFSARSVIDELTIDSKDWLLNQLKYYKLKHKIHSEYQFWQEGYHPQIIYSEDVFKQKLDYIHFNPVRRGLVNQPEHWRFSSAAYYHSGLKCDLDIDLIT